MCPQQASVDISSRALNNQISENAKPPVGQSRGTSTRALKPQVFADMCALQGTIDTFKMTLEMIFLQYKGVLYLDTSKRVLNGMISDSWKGFEGSRKSQF